MQFIDFKMRDLVGKTVVWTTSDTEKKNVIKTITKISEAVTEGFRIEGNPDRLFSYKNGNEKLPEGRRRILYGTVSICHLISEEKVKEIRDQFALIQDKKQVIQSIMDNSKQLIKLSIKDLRTFATKLQKVGANGMKR